MSTSKPEREKKSMIRLSWGYDFFPQKDKVISKLIYQPPLNSVFVKLQWLFIIFVAGELFQNENNWLNFMAVLQQEWQLLEELFPGGAMPPVHASELHELCGHLLTLPLDTPGGWELSRHLEDWDKMEAKMALSGRHLISLSVLLSAFRVSSYLAWAYFEPAS